MPEQQAVRRAEQAAAEEPVALAGPVAVEESAVPVG